MLEAVQVSMENGLPVYEMRQLPRPISFDSKHNEAANKDGVIVQFGGKRWVCFRRVNGKATSLSYHLTEQAAEREARRRIVECSSFTA